MADPLIEVKIPMFPGNLGHAYNLGMETAREWVIFIDSDIYLRTQPKWYEICQEAIKQHGAAGLFTCVTNRIACPAQRCNDAPASDNLQDHIEYARRRFDKFKYLVNPIPRVKPSGFFMMLHRKTWDKVKFPPGFLGVDNRYANQLRSAGFHVYLIEGLYLYHGYLREWRRPR